MHQGGVAVRMASHSRVATREASVGRSRRRTPARRDAGAVLSLHRHARLAQQAVLRTGYNHVLLRAVCVHTHSHVNLGSAQQLQARGIHSYFLCNYMDSNKTTKSSSSYR